MRRRYQSGVCVAWLVVVPVQAEAPPVRYTVRAQGETVYDTQTTLTWQLGISEEAMTWNEALGYCAGLSLADLDWHLPTRAELLTLVDPTEHGPAVDRAAFPDTPRGWFWSASKYRGSKENAWAIDFNSGASSPEHSTSETNRVRCVH